jgi:hypothetical protein
MKYQLKKVQLQLKIGQNQLWKWQLQLKIERHQLEIGENQVENRGKPAENINIFKTNSNGVGGKILPAFQPENSKFLTHHYAPCKAAAPATISESSVVIAAWRARL